MPVFGPWDLLIVALVLLFLLGPRQLPAVGRGIGELVRELRGVRKAVEQEENGDAPRLPP